MQGQIVIIFIDESGDLGFDLHNTKASHHFLITLLVCRDLTTLRSVKQAVVKTLRNKVNYNSKKIKNELKATNTTLMTKKYFMSQLDRVDGLSIHSIILDKFNQGITAPLLGGADMLYNLLVQAGLEAIEYGEVNSYIHVILDRSKNNDNAKIFNQMILKFLQSRLSSKVKITIEHLRSHEHYGLQAVDLFAGGIFRLYEHKNSDWYKYFLKYIASEDMYHKKRRTLKRHVPADY